MKSYRITKVVKAKNLADAIGRETEADIETIELEEDEEEDGSFIVGFHGK